MSRGPYQRRIGLRDTSHIGISTIAVQMPARVQSPSSFFVIDGKSFGLLPVRQPSVERVAVYRTEAQG